MDRHMSEALDRWLTTDPRDSQCECPECGECDLVETDCEHVAWKCHVESPRTGDTSIVTCRIQYQSIYHEPEILTCDCDEQQSPTCEVHR